MNPVAPDLVLLVREAATAITHYPNAQRATDVLAEALGVDPGRLVLTNGGAEAIALVAGLEPIGWVESPEFALYERHLGRLDPRAARWRSNPSNPLGVLAPDDAVARVWDEAFWQLATGTWTRGDDEAWRLGSLTKLWACPGLRIGYAIAPDEVSAYALRCRQPRWSVNALALAAVERLVAVSDLRGWAERVHQRRQDLVSLLRSHHLEVDDTDACWVLVRHGGLRDALLPHAVLVRDCATFGMDRTFRIAVPDDRGAERLASALRAALG
jgi:threonine-phosphate decarboxylase